MTDITPDRLILNDLEYLEMRGLNVMLAHDFYPESHQGGVGVIQNELRVATNGDLRLEPTPGQWAPVPKVGPRVVDRATGEISVRMEYPDEKKDRKGFNPIAYPDLHMAYTVRVRPEGRAFRIMVDLDEPLPKVWIGKVGFNFELFPGYLFGKTYATDDAFGIFPRQANGPGAYDDNGDYQIAPLATARRLTIAPESDRQRMTIEATSGGALQLIDGRGRHNNGWFVVRSLVEGGATKGAIEWLVSPNAIPDWATTPVVQVSQVGYHPDQPKYAVIELDRHDRARHVVSIHRVSEIGGFEPVLERQPEEWGRFLRYHYLRLDFTAVRTPGMYVVRYGQKQSAPFMISPDVYQRHVWQPTVDMFLPVQMCHMRVSENYRVWHGCCHLDDARMAPTSHNHFDGYVQGPSTLTNYAPGDHFPGLNRGGWHDAGDYDLRVESQSDTVYGLALAYEEFNLTYDNTTIDQQSRTVELHRPDGKPDVLQQVEHGVLTIVGGYNALGRLYRGIIEPTLRQYVHLGDAATQTDNREGPSPRQVDGASFDSVLTNPHAPSPVGNEPGADDRWVFTEDNPRRELQVGAALAAASRVLRGFNDALADDCRRIAIELYDRTKESDPLDRLALAVELLITTGERRYAEFILGHAEEICAKPDRAGALAARALPLLNEAGFTRRVGEALTTYRAKVDEMEGKTPYGLPYEPGIWGAGWGLQRFGVQQYWLHKHAPDLFPADYMLHALNFVLGCHPGSNTASFASGVGARSLIPGYGVNRMDESYIPGGIGSGTALIRPDFPELLEWPYLWQQTEYCLGNPTADFVFLVAAADHLLNGAS